MSDRHAVACRARRAELRARRVELTGGHRAELRSVLALSRVAAAAEITVALAGLGTEVAAHLRRADRHARLRFPYELRRAVHSTALRLHADWATQLRPGLLRIGAARGLTVRPTLPAARRPRLPAAPVAGPGRWRVAAAGAVRGATRWRLLLVPLALLPAWGLPILGGRALAPLAAGAGIAAVLLAARAQYVRAERVRLLQHAEATLAAAGAALEADLDRRLIELEATATAALDRAAHRLRAAVEAELARLPEPSHDPPPHPTPDPARGPDRAPDPDRAPHPDPTGARR